MEEPIWATQLIKDVLFLHNRTRRPKIKWMKSHGYCSSGTTYFSSSSRHHSRYTWLGHRYVNKRPDITMRIASGPKDDLSHKGLLLHELSHWLVRSRHHHDKVFWKKAWNLYYVFLDKDEFESMKISEFAYKGKAERVYNKLFLKA